MSNRMGIGIPSNHNRPARAMGPSDYDAWTTAISMPSSAPAVRIWPVRWAALAGKSFALPAAGSCRQVMEPTLRSPECAPHDTQVLSIRSGASSESSSTKSRLDGYRRAQPKVCGGTGQRIGHRFSSPARIR